MSTSSHRITKASLTLGSAIAIAGLVAALPAQAATSGNPCNGTKTSMKSSGTTDHTKTDHAGMSKRTKSSNSAACSGK